MLPSSVNRDGKERLSDSVITVSMKKKNSQGFYINIYLHFKCRYFSRYFTCVPKLALEQFKVKFPE